MHLGENNLPTNGSAAVIIQNITRVIEPLPWSKQVCRHQLKSGG